MKKVYLRISKIDFLVICTGYVNEKGCGINIRLYLIIDIVIADCKCR